MPILSITALKDLFSNKKVPNESSYVDLIDSCYNPSAVICQKTSSTTQSVNNGAWTEVVFNVSSILTVSSMHNASYWNRIYIPETGYYLIRSHVAWTATANDPGTIRALYVRKSGGATQLLYTAVGSAYNFTTYCSVMGVASLSIGDYVTSEVYQGSGSALSLLSGSNNVNRSFEVIKI